MFITKKSSLDIFEIVINILITFIYFKVLCLIERKKVQIYENPEKLYQKINKKVDIHTFYMCLLLNNSMKICKIEGCNNECDKNTRYCHKHLLERKAQQRAARKAAGLKVRTTWTKQCLLCGADFEAVNKHISKYCPECWNKIKHKT